MSIKQKNLNPIWDHFFEFILQNNNCCQLKNLNTDAENKDIYVVKVCNSETINEYSKIVNNDKMDIANMGGQGKFFMAIIPSSSKIFINLFCCGFTMEKIYSKFSKFGLAIEGCFNIEPITLLPYFYQGHEFGTDNIITTNSSVTMENLGFLVIDNHRITKIMDSLELRAYAPIGINVQYVAGERLYEKGRPFENINSGTIKEKNLIFAIDNDDNIFIVYVEQIDLYNLLLLLQMFGCRDAILLCGSDNINIIWKESGYNIYNKTDFIGNPSDSISNVITFSA